MKKAEILRNILLAKTEKELISFITSIVRKINSKDNIDALHFVELIKEAIHDKGSIQAQACKQVLKQKSASVGQLFTILKTIDIDAVVEVKANWATTLKLKAI